MTHHGDHFHVSSCGGDCNDGDATLHPEDHDGDLVSPCDGDCDDGEADLNLDDADGDGYDTCAGDCNDSNDSINPGETETCNGVDDDCDGIVPLGESDLDGDGFLYCLDDCDDNDSTVHPGAEEVCDGLDNDCDPASDENNDLDGDGFSMCDYGMGLNHLPALNADVGGLGVYDSWSAFGFVFADTANTYEPMTGLEEGYTSTVLWVESY